MADAATKIDAAIKIAMNMEIYRGKDQMNEEDYVKEHGTTAATTL